MIYEIRNYYVEPAVLNDYEKWVKEHALPYIRRRLPIAGFWVSTDIPAQVTGAPLDELGSANITWVIHWDDLETRNRVMGEVFGPGASEWSDITTHHPGRQHYRRIEAKFARGL